MIDLFTSDLLESIRQDLTFIGYQPGLIRADCQFRTAQKQGPSVRVIPMAAFAQGPPSERNSCLGIALPSNHTSEAIRPFRDLGAPQIISLYPQDGLARRWKMTAGEPQAIEEFNLSRLSAKFRENSEQWAPERIFQAKRAFPSNLPDFADQLDFLDLGLMPALEADLRHKLDRDIQGVLTVCRNAYEQWHPGAQFEEAQEPVFRLIFRLVAAKMLIDRGDKPQWAALSAPDVLRRVEEFYFSQEQAEPPLTDVRVQQAAWGRVRNGLDLQNLSVVTLAYVYENTFVTKAARRGLGIHATPPGIAEYVVRQLPIQKLPEQERMVFEPFTGPAPFLVAAMGRLRDLAEFSDNGTRHRYFQQMLSGIEMEPFAHEIARYSLILADYPNPDGWQIAPEDAYTSPKFDEYLHRANVVLCNPPFGSFNDAERQCLPAGASHLKDAEALRRVLQHPPACLGFVLPRPFLTRDEDRVLRNQIGQHYRDISVMVLPSGVFRQADVETVLLIAHNETEQPRYRSSFVARADLHAFLRSGEPTWEAETQVLPAAGGDTALWRRPYWQPLWDALNVAPRLGDLLSVEGRGLRYKRGLRNDCVSDEPLSSSTPGVNKVEEPYFIADYQYLCRDKDKLYRNPDLPWSLPKVIANTFRSSRGFWRIKGAIDKDELVFSEYCIGLWPQDTVAVEVLAAVISGPIANAFLWDHLTAQDNQIRIIKQIPVPQFTPEQTETIIGLVQAYQSYRDQWLAEPEREMFLHRRCLELTWQIDAEVLSAYALPSKLKDYLLEQFAGAVRRSLPFPFPGYGKGYEQAEQALQVRKRHEAIASQYQALVKKKYGPGLTVAETATIDRLGRLLDEYDTPSDLIMLRTVQESVQ